MINVDEVTASRLIFAPMGVFFGKCCGNATLKKVGALNNVRSELLRPAQSQYLPSLRGQCCLHEPRSIVYRPK